MLADKILSVFVYALNVATEKLHMRCASCFYWIALAYNLAAQSSIGIMWEIVINIDSQSLSQTYGNRSYILTVSTGDMYTH